MIHTLRDDSTSAGKQSLVQMIRSDVSSTLRWGKFFLLLVISLSLFQSCKDPDEAGLNVLPPGDELGTERTDTTTISTITITDDSLRSDELSVQLIGSINDPDFGVSNASVYTQVNLEGTPVFTNGPVADSLVLSLVYTGYYGDTTAMQTFNVFRLTEDISFDSSYYSSRNFAYDPTIRGSVQFQPQPRTRVVVGSDTVAAQIRIPLDRSIGDSILSLYGRTELSSNADFLRYFKGLYIQPVQTTLQNSGAISYFSFVSSKLILYFHDSIATGKKYEFSLAGGRVNHFEHDRSGSTVGTQLIDTTYSDSLNFIQSMCGVKTRISFPYIKNYISTQRIIINRAELSINIKPGSGSAQYGVPFTTLLLTRNEFGVFSFPIDYFESAGYFGGTINTAGNNYTFNITRQLQRYLDGTATNSDFDLIISGSGVSANRLIVGSGNNPVYPMKLTLYYTKIN